MSNPIANRKSQFASLSLLALITLLAAALRLYRASDPLWLDELHTAWTVADGLSQVAPRAAIGNQSPVYFYLSWASVQIWGMSEVAVRLPSLLSAVLLVPVMYWAVYRWTSSYVAALLVGLLTVIERDYQFYGQEARPYVVVQLFCILQVWAFWNLISVSVPSTWQRPARRLAGRAAFIVTSALLFYLHYTAALLIVGQLVCWLVLYAARRWAPRYRWTQLCVDVCLMIVICLPALPHLIEIAERRDNWIPMVEAWPTLGMLRFAAVYLLVPWVSCMVVLLVRWIAGQRPLFRPLDPKLAVLTLCWLLVPVTLVWLLTALAVAPLAKFRYIIAASQAGIVASGLACSLMPSRRWRIASAMLVIVAAVYASDTPAQYFKDGRFNGERNEQWPTVVKTINDDQVTHRWPVLLLPNLIEDHWLRGETSQAFQAYCLFPIQGIYRVEDRSRSLIPLSTHAEFSITAEQRRQVRDAGGAWIIVRGSDQLAKSIASSLRAKFEQSGLACETESRPIPGSVKLWLLRIIEPPG